MEHLTRGRTLSGSRHDFDIKNNMLHLCRLLLELRQSLWNIEKSFYPKVKISIRNHVKKNSRLSPLLLAMVMMISVLVQSANAESQARFKHIPLQYIVALGDPGANSGNDAALWGLWRQDPGPRGCRLENYKQLKATGVALAQWPFDRQDWWLEEHGLIMEKPTFPLPSGKYVVTGGQKVTSVLTVDPMDKSGSQHWQLDHGVKLYDVTHLSLYSSGLWLTENLGGLPP